MSDQLQEIAQRGMVAVIAPAATEHGIQRQRGPAPRDPTRDGGVTNLTVS
jgi:hypothetical protein